MSKTIVARMRPDGTVVKVPADGNERPFPETPMRPMTQDEIEAAANADPGARPFTPEELAKARRIPRVRTLRRALGLIQEEFAARYRIPLGTLRDWEQGRSQPDQARPRLSHRDCTRSGGCAKRLQAPELCRMGWAYAKLIISAPHDSMSFALLSQSYVLEPSLPELERPDSASKEQILARAFSYHLLFTFVPIPKTNVNTGVITAIVLRKIDSLII
jgi:putative transcriptional regulator